MIQSTRGMVEEVISTRERAQARVGQVLRDKWRLDEVLGVGGMAAVYAATHRNGKRGAVKLLHPEMAITPAARARFQREGYVANAVGHPGAVSVLDDDVADDGSCFLVMELLEGLPVDAIARSRPSGVLSVGETLALADAVLDILVAAHDRGIVHRDIKPENLFVTRDGAVRLLDFGIAHLKPPPGDATTTRAGEAMGTPAFMPPEQALGDWHLVDGRTDLWALSACLFTLLTGRYVHEAESAQRTMLAAMTREAPSLASALDGAPADVTAIVDRALAAGPEDRFSDARAMQIAVRDARARHPGALSTLFAGGERLADATPRDRCDRHAPCAGGDASEGAQERLALRLGRSRDRRVRGGRARVGRDRRGREERHHSERGARYRDAGDADGSRGRGPAGRRPPDDAGPLRRPGADRRARSDGAAGLAAQANRSARPRGRQSIDGVRCPVLIDRCGGARWRCRCASPRGSFRRARPQRGVIAPRPRRSFAPARPRSPGATRPKRAAGSCSEQQRSSRACPSS
mgnify:CR=1 FL=1